MQKMPGNISKKIISKVTSYLNDSKAFAKIKKGLQLEKLVPVNTENHPVVYIDKDKFEFRPVDVIQLESVKKKFVLLNDQKTIQFDSLINYDSVKLAEAGFTALLVLLTSADNYFIDTVNGGNQFKILVKKSESNVAVYFELFDNKEAAANKIKEIFAEITSHTYSLSVSDPIADNWQFKYKLIDPSGEGIEFVTQSNYKSLQNAKDAAQQFYGNISALKIKNAPDGMQLVSDDKKKIVAHAVFSGKQPTEIISKASQLLKYHQDLSSAINNPSKEIANATLKANINSAAEQYIYKLVDKDNPLAKFTIPSTQAEALTYKNDLINKFTSGYNYLGISFGWDIITERKDVVTNIIWYHYLIKCNNIFYTKGTSKDQPLVLIESIKGYASKEDAMQAFLDNYLIILRKAHLDTNYGVNKFISLTEILIHEEDSCSESQSNVFIPSETIYEYDGDSTVVIKEIMLLAKSYPILFISKGRYRFSLFNREEDRYDWRSVQWYATPKQAMQQFLFFLMLLNYSGNYCIEKNETDCKYRIYIREVLAISLRGFPTPYDAWGVDGIEKFICVAQTDAGFHNYLNRNNCSYSFYVACGNTGLMHPCVYETPERRDNVLNKLYQASSFNFFDLLHIDGNNLTLLDLDKKPVASLFVQRDAANDVDSCKKLIAIFESMYIDKNYDHPNSTDVYLNNANNEKIAEPVSKDITSADWKKQLLAIACYFPLIRTGVDTTITATGYQRQCDYYIQIKLPAFDRCEDDFATNNYVDENKNDDCKPGCYIAWKSDCCFATCCEALEFYISTLPLINNYANYKSVYECNCGYYGIELHTEEMAKDDNNNAASASDLVVWLCGSNQNPDEGAAGSNQNDFANECLNEVIAINPQQYSNSTIACEAVERAKKLINSEGLHLVEHILLRPQCKNPDHVYEDCNCQYLPRPCVELPGDVANDREVCHFEWKPDGDVDPCAKDEIICFTPGCDPYSFIATVALPAWPQRFRSVENRVVIEKLLQKEAPAHVLLRILWLKPRDFCCFEYYFRKWNYWLAKKICEPEKYSNCDFLGLLFHKHFDRPDDCNECIPCDCNDAESVPCFGYEKIDCPDFDLVNQLNNVYCWNEDNYDSYNCETYDDVPIPVPIVKDAAKISKAKKSKAIEASQSKPLAEKAPGPDTREKYLMIQSRSSRYKENVKKIVNAKPGNKAGENALRFLADANPDPERYDDLVTKILKNKTDKSKNIRGLTLKEKNTLIDNISWQYFDRVCLNEKKTDNITIHHALFNHLRKNKIDMHSLYDDWNSKEIKVLEPAINLNEIKKVVI